MQLAGGGVGLGGKGCGHAGQNAWCARLLVAVRSFWATCPLQQDGLSSLRWESVARKESFAEDAGKVRSMQLSLSRTRGSTHRSALRRRSEVLRLQLLAFMWFGPLITSQVCLGQRRGGPKVATADRRLRARPSPDGSCIPFRIWLMQAMQLGGLKAARTSACATARVQPAREHEHVGQPWTKAACGRRPPHRQHSSSRQP